MVDKKAALCFAVCFTLSLVFFHQSLEGIATMLSLSYIFGQHHAAPWGVLLLCFIWLWLKRVVVLQGMSMESYSHVFFVLGLVLLAVSLLMPTAGDFLVFQLLLAWLAVFIIFFGKGMLIPAILLGIYSFSISFPLIIERFAELPYSKTVILPATWILTWLGYPLESQGQWVSFLSSSGESISVLITAACAGPATMGVFIAIFALMMLDIPLPQRKAGYVFIFGIAGTGVQSFIRLIILLLVGYYKGEAALWTAHYWTIYILFPLWYLIFLYVYFYVYKKNDNRTQMNADSQDFKYKI
jgi:exosortase/archaeosortase family protein